MWCYVLQAIHQETDKGFREESMRVRASNKQLCSIQQHLIFGNAIEVKVHVVRHNLLEDSGIR